MAPYEIYTLCGDVAEGVTMIDTYLFLVYPAAVACHVIGNVTSFLPSFLLFFAP